MTVLIAAMGNVLSVKPQLTGMSDPLWAQELQSTGDRPICSVRFLANGDIEEAEYSTGTSASYIKVGTWVDNVSGLDGSEWEINFTVGSEDTGDPGTWTGSTRGSFADDLSATRTYTWTKDGTDLGTANSEVTCTVRNIATTSNSASRSNLSYDATIDV